MIIRSEQLAGMDETMQKRYHEKVCNLLREQSPQLTARFDDRTLLDRVAAAVWKADKYGLSTGEGILAFVGLSLAAGPRFHDNPAIRRFFETKADDPDLKIRWLFAKVIENLQQVIDGAKTPKAEIK